MGAAVKASWRRRTLRVEPGEGGLLTMDEEGNILWHEDAQAVRAFVVRRDKAAARGSNGVCTITVIEWVDMPDGFVAPQD